MSRPSLDEYFADMAKLTSSRGTCCRRKVGAVIVNKHNHVLATGYNGVPRGFAHCEGENKCAGAHYPSGEGLDKCEAIHAEQNALLQCKDAEDIDTIYVTAAPCITCVKLLLNTSCKRIVFSESYPHSDSEKLWTSSGREWIDASLQKSKYGHLNGRKIAPPHGFVILAEDKPVPMIFKTFTKMGQWSETINTSDFAIRTFENVIAFAVPIEIKGE